MKRVLIIIVFLMLLPFAGVKAQEVSKAKAMLTLNFIRYLGWPDDARQGDFVIGVVRDRETASWLKKLSAGKKLGFQDIVVKEYKNVDELEKCQLVFMSKGSQFRKNSEAVQSKLGKNSLIVTEEEGATAKGAMVNFVIRNDKLNFELHEKNAQVASITFSTKLKQLTGAINL